jgi:hypothetical protein
MVKAMLTFRKWNPSKLTMDNAEGAFLIQTMFNSFLPFIGGITFVLYSGYLSGFILSLMLVLLPFVFELNVVPVEENVLSQN